MLFFNIVSGIIMFVFLVFGALAFYKGYRSKTEDCELYAKQQVGTGYYDDSDYLGNADGRPEI